MRSSRSIGHIHCLSLYSILGFCSMVIQSVLVREFLVVVYGTELSLGLLFSSWLLWVAIGAEVGAYIAPKVRDTIVSFALWLIAVACLLPMQILLIRSTHFLLRTPQGEFPSPLPMALHMLLVLFPFSTAVGFTFPLGVRLYREAEKVTPRPVALIYMAEAVGSFLGGCMFTFLLVRILHPCILIATVSLMLCFASASLLWRAFVSGSFRALLCVIALVPAVLQLVFASKFERATVAVRWNSFGTGNELLLNLDSPYQNIAIGKRLDQYSLFCDGHFVTSFPDEYTNASLAMLLVAEANKPSNVLVIGNGLEGLLSQLLTAGVKHVDYVQTDPWLIDAMMPFISPPDKEALRTNRIKLLHEDGRRFVRETKKRYDLIFLHLGDPSTAQLNRYYTIEFFELVKRRLKEGGVLALHITGSESYFGEALASYVGSIYHTLKASFGHIAVSVGETTFMFAATKRGVVTESPEELISRAKRVASHAQQAMGHAISVATMPPQILLSYFPPLRSEWFRAEMVRLNEKLKAKSRLINSDLHPVSYFHYLRLWLHRSHPQVMAKVDAWMKIYGGRLLFAFLLFIAVLFAGDLVAQTALSSGSYLEGAVKRSSLLAGSFAGMGAMGLELLLLVAFQSLYSSLYQMVGALVATFMFGLAIGSMLMGQLQKRMSKGWHASTTLSIVSLAVALFSFSMPSVLKSVSKLHGMPLLLTFFLLLAISGLLTGMALPAAVGVYYMAMRTRGEQALAHATGKVDRADHLGASIGALITPVLLLPSFGVKGTCIIIGVLNGLAVMAVLCSSFALLRRTKVSIGE